MSEYSYATEEDWEDFWNSYDYEIDSLIAKQKKLEKDKCKQIADRIYEGFYKDEYDEFA